MKWIKHPVDFNKDPRMAPVLEEHGALAYAIFWVIQEWILEHGSRGRLRLSEKKWRQIFRCRKGIYMPILNSLQFHGLISCLPINRDLEIAFEVEF